MGIIIPILIGLLITHRIVSDIEKKNKHNDKQKHRDADSNYEKSRWMHPGVERFLRMTNFLQYVHEEVDVIQYVETKSCAYIGEKPHVIDIQSPPEVSNPILREINNIHIASTIIHEAAHHEAWDRWQDESENHPEKKELIFLKRLKPLLGNKPYKFSMPGDHGSVYSIACDIPGVFYDYDNGSRRMS